MINERQTDKRKGSSSASVGEMGEAEAMAERIRSGEAILEVVAYPWGVEFEVCESPQLLDIASSVKRKAPQVSS